ncbi:endonuclease domain-containing 1 protein [Ictalurus punctatus]|uniref:Endonuclease domain-containing 1 protein n=1 Tax=Ictalurus punctatus TaxID=7998 RepID=A0A2D0QIB5_ICTPU|nr:endonuclease domain-containing 1 protein [Ictalurus punctatus]
MKLLSVVLLLLPLSLCLAVVVDDFTESCPGFFANPYHVVSPPTGFTGTQYKRICQTLNNKAEFATLYDTTYRIPVYSAYRFTGLMKCNRLDKWHTEPELEVGMQDQNQKTCLVNQAENGDYKYSGYDRGHLAPVFLATSQNCADATFTLTNAAPQAAMFNRNTWMRTEKSMNDTLTKSCLNVGLSAFVVTGVVPGTGTLKNEGRVRIPSHFWMAFCCLDNNNISKHSGAYIGENINNAKVDNLDRQVLENRLNSLYGRTVTLFGGRC